MDDNIPRFGGTTQTANLSAMKTPSKATPAAKKPTRKEYTIKPSLQGKHDDQPVFQDKVNRANFLLKKFGVPKFD